MDYRDAANLYDRFSALPPAKWDEAYLQLTTDQRMALSDAASAVSTLAARISGYVSRRHAGGKHDSAVKAQNRAARKVRQALGYTYAQDTITF